MERYVRCVHVLDRLDDLRRRATPGLRQRVLAGIEQGGDDWEVVGLELGCDDPRAPVFGLFAGVHGNERIGCEIALRWLEALCDRLGQGSEELAGVRVVAIPVVNPGGVERVQRANPNGVDLMRNAPVESERPLPLVGGHRLSPSLLWYRGRGWEPEAHALVDFVRRRVFPSRRAVTLDLHSGFGTLDRLWYPYARQVGGYPHERAAIAFGEQLQAAMSRFPYVVEPQASNYTTHGDLWDHLVDAHLDPQEGSGVFLPWTLELGSWRWVARNPLQALRRAGLFHPLDPAATEAVIACHQPLLDGFLALAGGPWPDRAD